MHLIVFLIMSAAPDFAIVSGSAVQQVLTGRSAEVVRLVERAYLAHHAGQTTNPHSHFLRFTDRPDNRIIALPASLGAGFDVDGIKWIASVPGNIHIGLPRASAVLVLNDQQTGFPLACMESSIISATRTAASAVLAAGRLAESRRRISYVGAGLIAEYIHRLFTETGWTFDEVGVHDLRHDAASRFGARVGGHPVKVHDTVESAVRAADLVVFATTAVAPHVTDLAWLRHNPTVLNISLRDLGAEVILASTNFVDDVDHCLRAGTSPHLAEQHSGSRDFVTGTLGDVLLGQEVPAGHPVVFSPFGLGVLDLAVASHVLQLARTAGLVTHIPGFFPIGTP